VRAAQVAGLLYVGRNIVQVFASFPVGALADRIGAARTLRLGYALGTATALLMALTFVLPGAPLPWLIVIFVLAGLYMAVQEALEPTVTAEFVEAGSRGLAFGALGSVNGAAKFVYSASVGLLWTAVSPTFGFGFGAALMFAGTVALARLSAK
jgi:MFS family permease